MGDKIDLILEQIRVARTRFLAAETAPEFIQVRGSSILPAPIRPSTTTTRGRLLNAAALLLLELERLDEAPPAVPEPAVPEPAEARLFPIMDAPDIPWNVIAPWARRAAINHGGQSLERLAERGGLTAQEALAVLLDTAFFDARPRVALGVARELLGDVVAGRRPPAKGAA